MNKWILKVNVGWYRGGEFKLFETTILHFTEVDMVIVFSLQIAKLCFTVLLDKIIR